MKIRYVILIICINLLVNCTPSKPLPDILEFNGQVWMSKNLDVDSFQNGDPIPGVKTKTEWQKANADHQPAWCYFENNPENGKKYGRIYNWYAIKDPRRICPKSWHIPNSAEWKNLIDFMGGMDAGGKRMRKKEFKNGNNVQFGFCAEAGGYRDTIGNFVGLGYYRNWWVLDTGTTLEPSITSISPDLNKVFMNSVSPSMGLAIRCIKD